MHTLNAMIKSVDRRDALDRVRGRIAPLVAQNSAGIYYIQLATNANGEPEPVKKKKKKIQH